MIFRFYSPEVFSKLGVLLMEELLGCSHGLLLILSFDKLLPCKKAFFLQKPKALMIDPKERWPIFKFSNF